MMLVTELKTILITQTEIDALRKRVEELRGFL